MTKPRRPPTTVHGLPILAASDDPRDRKLHNDIIGLDFMPGARVSFAFRQHGNMLREVARQRIKGVEWDKIKTTIKNRRFEIQHR